MSCLYSDTTPSSIMSYINGVEKLGGNNFTSWKAQIKLIMLIMDKDHSMREDAPVAPAAAGDNDTTLPERTAAYEKEKERWERSDRVALMIMDMTINPAIRGALNKTPDNAKDFMEKVEEYFKGSTKANASTLLSKLMNTKYDGQGSVREHIMRLVDLRDKLKDLNCPLNDEVLLHHVMLSLPSVFDPFKINYNGNDVKWYVDTLIANCSQEEERLRSEKGDYVNLVRQEWQKGKGKRVINSKKVKRERKPYEAPKKDGPS